ncbi:MAG: radical SAM family heme chaperone HemW [Candidatus Omnitrophica bacterium]|nr:radical SAM family heme chaperone HemW [Candidatus Omnitrophota bacterium]MCM8768563.1 radical SAM family heme chaperone HemW [Candidatus Omnitrophota bacterium]
MNRKTAGLYIHVPFCRRKCPYCDFFSIPELTLLPAWLQAVCREAKYYQGKFKCFNTVYFGGGTPSLLSPSNLDFLLENLRRIFLITPEAEITLEMNPEDVSREKLRKLQGLGINRISLGLQSLDDEALTFLGRRHTAFQAEKALGQALEAGFSSVSVDLIYGLPGQKKQRWEKVLSRVAASRPHHVSCYLLTIKEGTFFARKILNGQPPLFWEKVQRDLFLFTSRWWKNQGYLHYEVSNFAVSSKHRCAHNLKYWQRQPYLGLGPSAHSFSQNKRWWNVSSVKEYCRLVSSGFHPVAERERLEPAQEKLETLFLGLRTADGVSLALFSNLPEDKKTLLEKQGLVKTRDDRLFCTEQGFLFTDALPLWLTGDFPLKVVAKGR